MGDAAFDDPRFVIQRRLGAGGMGVVYQALDREQNRVVALKTLRDAHGISIARFKHEFRALADVSHPNLVSLYELIAHPGRLFFTMELVVGKSFIRWVRHDVRGDAGEPTDQDSTSLDGSLAPPTQPTEPGRKRAAESPSPEPPSRGENRRPALDLTRLRPALRELAEGVAALHSAGMLHRDIKPSNVLVTPHGVVKILDFGLATELNREASQESREEVAGTACYMSPEQGARLQLGPASDWYAVGVMLYEALTGRLPFVGTRTEMLMDRQVYEPPPPSQLQPDVPEDLNALCVSLLRRVPEARPDAREVLRRLGSESAHTMGSSSHSTHGHDLIGRERHLQAIEDALAAAQRGRSVIQLVRGSSGMGKTALVRHFLGEVTRQDRAVTLAGRCYERESVPFKALDSLIDALGERLASLPRIEAEGLMPRDVLALARLFPVLRQVESVTAAPRRAIGTMDPLELRRRAFGALRELLVRLADRRPVVLAIDDLQWGDVDSAALLASVLRPPDAPSLLLLACCRTEDWNDSPFLRELRAQLTVQGNDVRELAVEPLEPGEATRLALALLDGHEAATLWQAQRIAQEAAGSPFFIDELARHVTEGEAGAPERISLEEVLTNRVRRLAPDASRLLSAVAVAGHPIPLSVATRAAEVYEPSAVAVLKAGNLVRTRGASEATFVECYHDRIRETSLALLSPDQLRHTHLRLAIALESSPQPDAEALAIHFREAGEVERAAEYAIAAAERAEQALAFDRAADLYRLALTLRPVDRAARTLRVRLGEALAHAGRGPEAAQAFLSATDQAPAAEALDLQRRAAAELLRAGRISEGIAAFGQVLDAVGMQLASTPARALLRLLWHRARVRLRGLGFRERDETQVPADELMRIDVAYAVTTGLGMVDSIRAAEFEARQLMLALDAGEPHRVMRALAAETCMLSMRGTRTSARTAHAYAAMEALGRRLDTHEARALVIGVRGIIHFQEGRWKQGFELCDQATELLRDNCRGLHWELTTCHAFALFALARQGRYRLLSERLTTLLKEANERGDLYAVTNMTCAVGYCRTLTAGDVEGTRAELTETIARWNVQDTFHLQHFNGVMSNSYVDLYLGDGAQAWKRLNDAWPSMKRSVLLRMQTLRCNALSARSRAALCLAASTGGDQLLAAALADARRLEGENTDYGLALGRLIRATVAHRRGQAERALALLEESEALFDATDMHLNAAAARWHRGRLVGGELGAELMARAQTFCSEEGIVQPLNMLALAAPGFD